MSRLEIIFNHTIILKYLLYQNTFYYYGLQSRPSVAYICLTVSCTCRLDVMTSISHFSSCGSGNRAFSTNQAQWFDCPLQFACWSVLGQDTEPHISPGHGQLLPCMEASVTSVPVCDWVNADLYDKGIWVVGKTRCLICTGHWLFYRSGSN